MFVSVMFCAHFVYNEIVSRVNIHVVGGHWWRLSVNPIHTTSVSPFIAMNPAGLGGTAHAECLIVCVFGGRRRPTRRREGYGLRPNGRPGPEVIHSCLQPESPGHEQGFALKERQLARVGVTVNSRRRLWMVTGRTETCSDSGI